MVLSGKFLYVVLVLLAAWFALLCRALWKLIRASSLRSEPNARGYATLAGIGSAALAVGALLALHLSWVSVDISQHLGIKAIRILSLLLFWPTLAGILLCTGGRGRIRFLGIATCLVTGLWWFSLSMGAAISMGAAPTSRHPTRYLIPEGYVGWVKINHGEKAAPLQLSNGKFICRIPASGVLDTSSNVESGWAKDEYLYYSSSNVLRELPETGWDKGGMIWANHSEFQATQDGSLPSRFTESFYVGTEEQYHRSENCTVSQPQELKDAVDPKGVAIKQP
jgi:hypothetical protein